MILVIASIMTLNVSAAQYYIYDSSAGFVKMTGSLYGYTPTGGTTITLGDGITRSDYVPGKPQTYTEVKLKVVLYKNYDTTGVLHFVITTGIQIAIAAPNGNTPIGDYISTGNTPISGATNIGSYHSIQLPNGDLYMKTLGMYISSGVLYQDTLTSP